MAAKASLRQTRLRRWSNLWGSASRSLAARGESERAMAAPRPSWAAAKKEEKAASRSFLSRRALASSARARARRLRPASRGCPRARTLVSGLSRCRLFLPRLGGLLLLLLLLSPSVLGSLLSRCVLGLLSRSVLRCFSRVGATRLSRRRRDPRRRPGQLRARHTWDGSISSSPSHPRRRPRRRTRRARTASGRASRTPPN
mmetsp:Transcript_8271/g.25629  ORF Transcript_8271/g.25629 Transcript_8271/m.25629 type:complete len:200 (+) Transcript_8271:180-779(+)